MKMSLLRTVGLASAVLNVICVESCMAKDVTDIRFPVQRQAAKIVPGLEGSDEGDYSGRGSRLLAHLQDLGIDLTRVGIAWSDCEPARGCDYDWSKPDELINFLIDRGIEPLVVLFSCPQWARTTHPEDSRREKEVGVPYVELQMPRLGFEEDYARWAEAVARRYKGRVQLYEFWNEPDGIPGPVLLRDKEGRLIGGRTGGDPVLYAHWLKIVHTALKQGNPDCKLAAGSLSVCDPLFMEAIYESAGKDAFEAISFHPYLKEGMNVSWLKQLRKLSLRYGHPECEQWITEYDWTPVRERPQEWSVAYGCGEVSEKLPSDGVRIGAHYPFVTQLYLHTLNDWGEAPGGALPWEGFGLLDIRLNKKPKYEEFREALLWRRESLNREIALQGPSIVCPGRDFEIAVEPSLVKDVGDLTWFVPEGWNVRQSGGPGIWSISVPSNAASEEPYPITGRNAQGYCFTRYIEVVEPLQLTNVMPKTAAGGARSAQFTVRVENISGSVLDGQMGFDLPAGWSLKSAASLKCKANTTTYATVEFTPARDVAPGVYLAVARLMHAGRECGSYKFQLICEAEFPQAANPPVIDGKLDDWRGARWTTIPGDASPAEFAGAWDDENLYVAVRVRDDKHVQTKSIQDAWQEDCIQFAFDTLCDAVPGGKPTLDDYEMTFALLADGPHHYRYTCPPESYGGECEAIKFAAVSGDGVTVYEIAIPWDELRPAQAKPDAAMGMCIAVNDSDGDKRKTSTWGRGIIEAKLPINYSRIRLVK